MNKKKSAHATERTLVMTLLVYRQPFSGFHRRMIFCDPLLHDLNEFFRLRHNLLCFRFRRNENIVVVNHVPLPPASVEIITIRVRSFPNCQLNHVEGNPVVSSAGDAVAGTHNRHFAACNAALYAVAKRRSDETPFRDASAKSRAITARSLSNSFLDVLC